MERDKGTLPAWAAPAAAALCLAGAAAVFLLPASNPDVFWHLSAGRWMAEHLAFPRADWLSHTMFGSPWTDFEWLSQLVFLAAHGLGGLAGLWALKALLFAAAAAVLWGLLGLYAMKPLPRALAVLAWALGTIPANDLRPENFSMLLFLGLFWWLEARRLGRISETGLFWQGLCSAAGFALWANLHAGFLFGLILLGIYAAAESLRRRTKGPALLWAASAAAVLLNPYGVQAYSVPWEHLRWMAELGSYIAEWQPPTLSSAWRWGFWGVLFASFAAVLLRQIRERDVPYEHLAALACFALAASGRARAGLYCTCVAVPVLAASLCRFEWRQRSPRIHRGLLLGVLAASWIYLLSTVPRSLSYGVVFNPRGVPSGIADFLEEEEAVLGGSRMLHPWHWGGYLGWRLSPVYKVWMDGRYIFHHWLKPLHDARQSPYAYQDFLDRNDIELVVRERGRQSLPQNVKDEAGNWTILERPFYLYFLPRKHWALVYWDGRGSVFVRRSVMPADWVREREFEYFRPRDLRAAWLQVRKGRVPRSRVEREAQRFLAWADPVQSAAVRKWLRDLRAEMRE